jgi:hypothetical protein
MVEEKTLTQPGLPWRLGSSVIIGIVGSISRLFLYGANTTDVHGLDDFLGLLDKRVDVRNRQRALITGKSCTRMATMKELKGCLIRSVKPYQRVRMYHILQPQFRVRFGAAG